MDSLWSLSRLHRRSGYDACELIKRLVMRNIVKYALPFLFLFIGVLYLVQSSAVVSSNIIFAVLGGGLLGILTFLRPEIGIYFVLFTALFFPEVPVGSVGTGLTSAQREIGIRPEDILIIFIAIGWFARLVAKRELLTIPQTPINLPIIILSCIMVIATLIGVLFGSVSLATGFFYTLKRLEYFLIFFMVIVNIKTVKEVKTGLIFLLIASAFVALYGIIEHAGAPEARISSSFQRSQANILGGFFVIIIFMALSFLLNYRSITTRLWVFIVLCISLYAVIWTKSRSSYSALYLGLIIFSLLARKPFLLVIPILFIIFQSSLLPEHVLKAIQSIKGVYSHEEFNPSWASRVESWNDALPRILSSPFLGYGLGAFDLARVDNQYIMDALYMGLTGLGVFIWLIVRLFSSIWAMHLNSAYLYNRALALGFVGGLIGLLIQGIAVTNFYTIRTMVTFWFLSGLVMVAIHLEAEQKVITDSTQKGEKFEST